MGAISRSFFETSKERNEIEPSFSDCPFECLLEGKQYDFNRHKKCGTCPHKLADESFKADYDDLITAIFGKDAKKYPFEKMKSVLYKVMNFAPDNKNLSIKNYSMLATFEKEKSRFKAIEEKERERVRKNG